jgi:hypothetical protein
MKKNDVIENITKAKDLSPLEEIDSILDNLGFDDRKKIMAIDYVLWKAKQKAPITKKQKEILDVISSLEIKKGYAPTLEEVATHLGLKSISTVHEHIRLLSLKGHIIKDKYQPRGYRIIS